MNKVSIALIVVIVAGIAYYVLNMPDQRTAGQKIGDAVQELPNAKDAGRQLENRTPGQKLEDAAHDEKQDVKKDLNLQH
jgi:hypothetical protein